MGFDIKTIHQIIQPHAQTHHVVIVVVNIVIAMLALCDFPYVTHYNKSLISLFHVNITNLLNIKCTLVAMDVILGKLRCIWHGDKV